MIYIILSASLVLISKCKIQSPKMNSHFSLTLSVRDIFSCLTNSLSVLQLPKLFAFGHTEMRQDTQLITVYVFLYLYRNIFYSL